MEDEIRRELDRILQLIENWNQAPPVAILGDPDAVAKQLAPMRWLKSVAVPDFVPA